jgi:hypothetical protein
MNMDVEDGLTRHGSNIHAEVESDHVRVGLLDHLPLLHQQIVNGVPLGGIELEEGGHMAFGDDQRVALADGV